MLREAAHFADYFDDNPLHWPETTTGWNTTRLILTHLAGVAWTSIVADINNGGAVGDEDADVVGALDYDIDGTVGRDDLKKALHDRLGFTTHPDEHAFVDAIRAAAVSRGARGFTDANSDAQCG